MKTKRTITWVPFETQPFAALGRGMTDNATHFANLLKDWRAKHKLTQTAAAIALGRKLRTYQGWESGRAPSADTQDVTLRQIQTFRRGGAK